MLSSNFRASVIVEICLASIITSSMNLGKLSRNCLVLKNVNISGNSAISSRNFLNEDEIFLGKENPVVYKRFYEMVINCEMEMQQYPFDNQSCAIGVTLFSLSIKVNRALWCKTKLLVGLRSKTKSH